MISFLKPEEQHQHRNGGGWVANTVTIDESVYVAPNAQVSGNARVSGNTQVSGNARVFGDVWIKTPLFIQGTRHAVSNSKRGYLSIGCVTLTFAEWKKQYRAIGKKEGYTAKQIKEYGAIIALATKIGK
jgi:UDP-3-O-[3-hydroxymyristoyl] glucosamine N-acyltransferase